MPLRYGWSGSVIGSNIRELVKSGRQHDQAVAIALQKARISKMRAAAIIKRRKKENLTKPTN